jgi:hypothetical protein
VLAYQPTHPNADHRGYVYEHILIAEVALGRYLKSPEEVHHVDEDPGNNSPRNLVICHDHAYHYLLHARMRAFRACGHVDWRPCFTCGQYAPVTQMLEFQRVDRPNPHYSHRQKNGRCLKEGTV